MAKKISKAKVADYFHFARCIWPAQTWFSDRRQGEKIPNVECARINEPASESAVLLTLTLLTDEQGHPDAIAMMTKHVSD